MLFALLTACSLLPTQAPQDEPVVVLMNGSDQEWTDLSVLVDGVPSCQVASLPPHGTVSLKDGACTVNAPAAQATQEAAPEEAAPPQKTDAPAQATAAAKAAPASADKATLHGSTKVSGGFGPARRIGVTNLDDFQWTNCTVTLNHEWRYHLASLDPGEYEGIMGARFRDKSGDIMTKNHQIQTVGVSCSQGSGTFRP